MGVCTSSSKSVDRLDAIRNREINAEIERDSHQNTRKMLLLGAGECGKTTILKQMRLINDELSENEMLYHKPSIYQMVTASIFTLIDGMHQLGIQFQSPENYLNKAKIDGVIANREEHQPIEEDICTAIEKLWLDGGVQEAYALRDQFHLVDAAKYFIENVSRISADDYQPTVQDILNLRTPTMGVQEVRFRYRNLDFRVFDCGGQKSQRKKWVHAFDDVDLIIFISAVSEFNQTMREDFSTNRLLDSVQLFSTILSYEWFKNTSVVLFFNKTDLFDDKLRRNFSIRSAFPEYSGENDYKSSLLFIREKFSQEYNKLGHDSDVSELYIHETCATDTSQVHKILQNVIDTVMNKKLKTTMLY